MTDNGSCLVDFKCFVYFVVFAFGIVILRGKCFCLQVYLWTISKRSRTMAVFISVWFFDVFFYLLKVNHKEYIGPNDWLLTCTCIWNCWGLSFFYNRKRLPKLLACLPVSMWLHHWWVSWWTTILNRSQWGHCNNSTLTWFSVNVSHIVCKICWPRLH